MKKQVNNTSKKAASKIETVKAAKVEKPIQKLTFKEQIESNKRFKDAINIECKKLGYALSLIEKHIDCFSPLVQNYVKDMREQQILYKAAEIGCKRTKAGNYSAWLLQSYIREQINKG